MKAMFTPSSATQAMILASAPGTSRWEDKDRLVLAQDVHGDAVDAAEADAAAAQALAADLERAAAGLRDGDVDGVGVQGRVVPADGKAVGQAALVGNLEQSRMRSSSIIQAQDAPKCAIGAVARGRCGRSFVPQREGDGGRARRRSARPSGRSAGRRPCGLEGRS